MTESKRKAEKHDDPLNDEAEFIKKLDELADQIKLGTDKKTDPKIIRNTFGELCNRVAKNMDSTPLTARIAILLLLQSGSYMKSVSNRLIKLDDKEFTKREITHALEQIKAPNITLRNIAYVYRDDMATVARKYNIPGNLYAQFKIINTNINPASQEAKEISFYCTDVQFDNPNAPQAARDFLSRRKIKRSN